MTRSRMNPRVAATVIVLIAWTASAGCHRQPPLPAPLDVPTDPCPTKETFSPGSDVGPEIRSAGSLKLDPDLQREFKGVRVTVEALIDARGRPVECTVRIVPGPDARLHEPARAALIATRYRPATLQGLPVPAWIKQPFIVP